MWDTIERARRRLRGDQPTAAEPSPGDGSTGGIADAGPADLTLALGRPELERLIGALVEGTGRESRADTPARLEAALTQAIEMASGSGRPAVTRRPAGLYTPETWQIEIADADGRTRALLEQAIRGGAR